MGTPQAGSDTVEQDRMIALRQLARLTVGERNESAITALAARCNELVQLSNEFRETTIFKYREIEICSFYETCGPDSPSQVVGVPVAFNRSPIDITLR